MGRYTSIPEFVSFSGANPNIDEQQVNPLVDLYWKWPEGDWDRFRIVRRARSAATRVEEGRRIMDTTKESWRDYSWDNYAHFRDTTVIPGEWNFYTAFVLSPERVWFEVGTTSDIGIENHGNALGFPELLPGANLDMDRGTANPGSQGNVLVNFLQPLGVAMDRFVTMTEASRLFFDPRSCAPRMLQFLQATYGYRYTGILPMIRSREVTFSIRLPDQGKLDAISRYVGASSGCMVTDAYISDNLFLNTHDSSFEGGPDNHGWDPVGTAPNKKISVLPYSSGDTGLLPVNTAKDYYAVIAPGKYYCGTYLDWSDPDEQGRPSRVFDPVKAGIPCADWNVFRMCMSIRTAPGVQSATVTMGADFYDDEGNGTAPGVPLVTTVAYGPTTVTPSWEIVGNSRSNEEVVPVEFSHGTAAYAVPWIELSATCYVDLIVIDDGRR